MRGWILLLSACWFLTASVNSSEVVNTRSFDALLIAMEQQLQADTARHTLLSQRLNALQRAQHVTLSPDLLTKSFLKRMMRALAMQESEARNIELTFKAVQMEVELTQSNIQNLQRRNLDISRHLPISPEVEATIRHQVKLLEIQQKRARVLQNTRDLLYKTVTLTKGWYKQLQIKSQSAVQKQHETTINSLVAQLSHIQTVWMSQLENLSKKIDFQENLTSITQITDLLSMLQTVAIEEESNAIHIQLDLEMISNELQTVCDTLTREPPLMVLNTLQKPLENIFSYLQLLENVLSKKYAFLKEGIHSVFEDQEISSIGEQSQGKDVISGLEKCCVNYQQQSHKVYELRKQAESAQKLFTRQLHSYLSSRQDLPGLDVVAWLNILQKLKQIPNLLNARMVGLSHLVFARVQQASWIQSSLAVLLALVWMRVLILVKRLIRVAKQRVLNIDESKEQLPTLFSFGVKLFDRYIYTVLLSLALCSVSLIWKIPLSAFLWLLNLVVTSMMFGMVIQICRFLFVESVDEKKRNHNKIFYYRLRSVLTIGRLVTLFSLVVHQLVLDYEVRNLVARVFMLFLFIIALVFFRVWALVPQLLDTYWVKRPRYLKQVVRWLSFLLPMTLLLNAILGLIGYVQLAWAIVGYQSVLLLALCIYPLIKGLLNECFNWLSEQSIRHLHNGWLWTEALLKPLYQVLKLLTFFSIILLLFSFAGWREELRIWSTYPAAWFGKTLVTVFEVPINTWKIIEVALMSVFVAWLSRWTREFAYRSIFANLKDLGLRNSLSVFTQYMAVFLAILATLQLVGLTLSVLKYILSGFAIGLSFGLRDLLNNFVTGILLLVERPVQVGDWVTIGEYDGQVSYIGARSITINTEDRKELMVPNADLFYKHFVNWTRHDSIVRITLPLLVNRKDDPIRVRELILEVLATIPKILNNPSFEVHFKSSDEMLLSFKIKYYVNLTQITSRAEVNSQFLFALWKRFNEENITPPVLVHELHLKGQLGMDQFSLTTKAEEKHA